MARFIIKKLLQSLVVILIVSAFTYTLTYAMPGDPVYAQLGSDITQEQYDIAFHKMGLDKPLVQRYLLWLKGILAGDFGTSFKYNMPVIDLVKLRLPVTLYFGLLAIAVSTVFGVILGVVSATRRGRLADTIITIGANIFAVTPLFWMGVLGIYIFSVKLGKLPSFGYEFPGNGVSFIESLRHTVLPLFCLSVGSISGMTRQTRSSMLEVVRQDYIRTARAKGLSENKVIYGHALRNALIPIVTLVAMSFSSVVAGSVSIDTVFSIGGMGQLMTNSILARDVAVTQACILLISVMIAISNLLVEILYGILDPRIRIQ